MDLTDAHLHILQPIFSAASAKLLMARWLIKQPPARRHRHVVFGGFGQDVRRTNPRSPAFPLNADHRNPSPIDRQAESTAWRFFFGN